MGVAITDQGNAREPPAGALFGLGDCAPWYGPWRRAKLSDRLVWPGSVLLP